MPSAEGGTFSLFTMPLRLNSTSEFHDENDVVMIDEHWHLLSRFLRTHFEVHHRSDSDFFDFDASEGILYEASSGQKNPPKSFAFGEQAEILTRRKRFFLLGFMLVASEMILPYVVNTYVE